jgi:GTPase SAR1 family protein
MDQKVGPQYQEEHKENKTLVYFVIGDSGAGKSSFINCYSGKELALVGNDAHSTTIEATSHGFRSFILIDTRGTNDTSLGASDEEIVISLLKHCIANKQ